jgi:nucleotide-binding universal stress UspA family protein
MSAIPLGPPDDVPAPTPALSPHGVPLPIDLRSGPIVAGVDDAIACGRPLRAAVFLSRATGRSLLLVHVRRRAMPMVEGYVPIPEEIGVNDEAVDAVVAELVRALSASGDLEGVTW